MTLVLERRSRMVACYVDVEGSYSFLELFGDGGVVGEWWGGRRMAGW